MGSSHYYPQLLEEKKMASLDNFHVRLASG